MLGNKLGASLVDRIAKPIQGLGPLRTLANSQSVKLSLLCTAKGAFLAGATHALAKLSFFGSSHSQQRVAARSSG
jgi:hypothetical protein